MSNSNISSKKVSASSNNYLKDIINENDNDLLFIEHINLTKLQEIEYDNINYNEVDSEELLILNNQEILSNSSSEYNNNDNDKIKDKFISLDDWYNNNILCWYCTCSFNNKPIFIPKCVINNKIDAEGNFCSFHCCCKYINIYYKADDKIKSNYINNLKYLYKIFYGKEVKIIRESPDKEMLKKFGGFMSETEYKECIKKLKNIYY